MSVSNGERMVVAQLGEEVRQMRQFMVGCLNEFRRDVVFYHENIEDAMQELTGKSVQNGEDEQDRVSGLEEELREVRNERDCILAKLQSRQEAYSMLKEMHAQLKSQQIFKQEKIQELNIEIQQIRQYIIEMQQEKEKDNHSNSPVEDSQGEGGNVVNFDDGSNQAHNQAELQRFNDLETIREVSQYDMSVSASMDSLSSCLNEGFQGKVSGEIQTSTTIEAKPVQNYQDALDFLKNYNNINPSRNEEKQPTKSATNIPTNAVLTTNTAVVNGGQEQVNACSMTRKNKLSITSAAKENLPVSNTGGVVENRPYKNDTIAKIKKMRKIESLELESGYVVKSDKKQQEDYVQARKEVVPSLVLFQQEEERNNSKESLPPSGRSLSHPSYLPPSEHVSLKQPIQLLQQIVEHVNSSCLHTSHVQTIQASLCKKVHQNGMHFHGNCDRNQAPHGYGKLYRENQVIYQGEWRNGKMHGWGKLVLLPFLSSGQASKQIIEVDGNFRNGYIEGTCVCLFTSGQKFMGSIKQGQIQHEGTFVGEQGIMTGHWESSSLILLI